MCGWKQDASNSNYKLFPSKTFRKIKQKYGLLDIQVLPYHQNKRVKIALTADRCHKKFALQFSLQEYFIAISRRIQAVVWRILLSMHNKLNICFFCVWRECVRVCCVSVLYIYIIYMLAFLMAIYPYILKQKKFYKPIL